MSMLGIVIVCFFIILFLKFFLWFLERVNLKILLVFLFCLTIKYSFAQEERWSYFSEDDSVTWYYDNETIGVGEDIIVVWWKLKYPKDTEVDYVMHRMQYYCLYKSYLITKTVVYTLNGDFEEYEYPDGKNLKEIIPDTWGEEGFNYFYKMWQKYRLKP